jgi:integrase
MGRPLTGGLRFQRGTWWASVPDKTAASGRRYESFLAEEDARVWLAQAVPAVQAGRPLPAPEGFRTRKRSTRPKPAAAAPAKIQPDVASVAKAWMSAAYEDLRRGGPDRAERVRRVIDAYLVPWFAPRTTSISDLTYLMAHEWVLHLIGRQQTAAPTIRSSGLLPQSQVDPDATELTLTEAAHAVGVSLPTVRRRWRDGRLPGAYRDPTGQIRVPISALASITNKKALPTGLSRSYVADALWVLRQVLAFARANGLFPAGFDPTEGLEAPAPDPAAARTRAPRAQPRPLTLAECARVAGHLHPVHQIVFWLQRIMGLRISEAYGLLVSDLVDLGGIGMLAVQGQGGRTFNVRDDRGKVVAVPHKQTTKTAAGSRVLVVPERLMDLLRIAIEAFHTDPDTGGLDTTTRLVPGIHDINRAGQAGYIAALEESTAAESLGTADLGFRVSSHLLRKSLATDLAWETGIEDPIRRRFMGHRAGDDVYGRIYTLDHPEVAPLVKVAAVLDDKIAASIATLVAPTTRQIQWGRANPLAERDDHIQAILGAAGWLVDPGDPDDPLCDAQRVADELGIAVMTARRWMADGIVASMVLPDSRGVPRRFARLSAVWATRDRLAERVLLPDLAEQLGLRYHELYHMVRHLDLNLELYPGTREYQVTPDAAVALRAEHARVRALHRRSMKLAAAARQMKVAAGTAGLLARRGDLSVDPETDSSGAIFVTRASVEQCWIARATPRQRRAQVQPGMPIAEVSRFTGHSTRELMDLVRAGVLEQVPGRRACELTAASLRLWLSSGPDGQPVRDRSVAADPPSGLVPDGCHLGGLEERDEGRADRLGEEPDHRW